MKIETNEDMSKCSLELENFVKTLNDPAISMQWHNIRKTYLRVLRLYLTHHLDT